MKIPSQYNRLMPYLILENAAGFRDFMIAVFDAEEQMRQPREGGGIMHGELRIGDAVIMYADSTTEFKPRPAGMFIYVESVDDVYKKAIAHGALSKMEPAKQPYGYTCGFTDGYGNDWWPVQGE